jgi:hypothetical protein
MTPTPPLLPRRVEAAVVVGLLILFATLCYSSFWNTSNTFDEVAHLTSGYAYWTRNEYRFQPENGNLPQRLAALPLLTQSVRWPTQPIPEAESKKVNVIGHLLFFYSGNDIQTLLRMARLGILASALGLGLVVYFWSRRLHGPAGGLISLALFAFCPTLAAHGAMITSDMTAALFFLLAAWALWAMMHRLTPGRVLAAGLALGGLCVAKFSAVLIAPVAMLLLAVRVARGQPLPLMIGRRGASIDARPRIAAALLGGLIAACLVALAVIWAAYGWRDSATAEPELWGRTVFVLPWEALGHRTPMVRWAVNFARHWHLLPEAFLYGFLYTVDHAQARQAFLHGRFSIFGWPWFFPYTFLVKTPLALFALAALGAALALGRRRAQALYQALPLGLVLIVYWAAAIQSNLNIGHRHVLLTYPALYILLGGIGAAIVTSRLRGLRPAVAALLIAFAAESLSVWPHYLSFFNLAAGGPAQGYRHLVDSSLDWGQDLPALKQWLDRHVPAAADRPPVFLSYFGTSSPEHHGIQALPLPGYDIVTPVGDARHYAPLAPGWYCVSATLYQSVYQQVSGPWNATLEAGYQELRKIYQAKLAQGGDPSLTTGMTDFVATAYRQFPALRWARVCAWLRSQDRTPDAMAGYSILIFRLSDWDLRAALDGPMPVDPVVSSD